MNIEAERESTSDLVKRLRSMDECDIGRGIFKEAADRIEELTDECKTFRHGHRIASDNCVRLEALLEEASSYTSPDGYSVSRNHDGHGLLLKDGKVIWIIKDLIKAARGYRVMEWISVEERLPEFDDDVAVRTRSNNILHGWLTTDDDWWVPELNTWVGGDGKMVTHWMPLAASPSPSDERNE